MWKCEKCKNIFDDDEIEYVGECPECKHSSLIEAEQCPGCGEWISLEEFTYDKGCPNCVNEVRSKFSYFFGGLEPWEQDVLELLADGIWLKDIVKEN